MEYFVIVSKRTQLNLLLKALWKYFPLVCFMWSAQSSLSMVIIGLCSCKTKPWDLGYCLVSLIFFLQFWFIILCSASLTFTATLKSQLDKRNANYKMFSGSRTTKTCRSSNQWKNWNTGHSFQQYYIQIVLKGKHASYADI